MKRNTLILALLTCSLSTIAQEQADSSKTSAEVEHYSLWKQVTARSTNPSLMGHRYTRNYSEIHTYINYAHANQPLQVETGTGHTLYGAEANTYIHFNPLWAVWGKASYQTGKKYNVNFCSTADYTLLAPYVMADSIGGDLNNEQYTFQGGIAHQTGRWQWGASIDFRAEHEYRTTDPRPRSIVTDMTVRLGANYLAQGYRWAVGIGGNFYKQTNSVKFFREEGVIPEYQMTGLGSDYARFSGTNNSAYYKATGLVTDVAIEPETGNGFYLNAQYTYTPYRKILPELNALPFATLYLSNTSLQIGYQHQGQCSWSTYAGLAQEQRQGDEHISGSSSGTEYRTLLDLTMYKRKVRHYYVGGILQVMPIHLTLQLQGGYRDDDSKYIDPQRAMQISKAYGQLQAQWHCQTGKNSQLIADAHVAYDASTQSSITMPYLYMDEARIRLVDTNFEHAKANVLQMGAGVRYHVRPERWKGYGYFAHLQGGYQSQSNLHREQLTFSIGLLL